MYDVRNFIIETNKWQKSKLINNDSKVLEQEETGSKKYKSKKQNCDVKSLIIGTNEKDENH